MLNASLCGLQNLRELRLPSTVLSEEEFSSIRTPYTTFPVRRSAMIHCTEIEACAVKVLGKYYPALESVTFIRPANPLEFEHHAITYRTHAAASSKPIINIAVGGQHPHWPFTSSIPLRIVLRKWWLAPPGVSTDLALSYLADLNHVASVLRAWRRIAWFRWGARYVIAWRKLG